MLCRISHYKITVSRLCYLYMGSNLYLERIPLYWNWSPYRWLSLTQWSYCRLALSYQYMYETLIDICMWAYLPWVPRAYYLLYLVPRGPTHSSPINLGWLFRSCTRSWVRSAEKEGVFPAQNSSGSWVLDIGMTLHLHVSPHSGTLPTAPLFHVDVAYCRVSTWSQNWAARNRTFLAHAQGTCVSLAKGSVIYTSLISTRITGW